MPASNAKRHAAERINRSKPATPAVPAACVQPSGWRRAAVRNEWGASRRARARLAARSELRTIGAGLAIRFGAALPFVRSGGAPGGWLVDDPHEHAHGRQAGVEEVTGSGGCLSVWCGRRAQRRTTKRSPRSISVAQEPLAATPADARARARLWPARAGARRRSARRPPHASSCMVAHAADVCARHAHARLAGAPGAEHEGDVVLFLFVLDRTLDGVVDQDIP